MMHLYPRHSNMATNDMNASYGLAVQLAVAILGIGERQTFGQGVKPVEFVKPTPNKADEPLAKEFSLGRTAEFLDAGSLSWTQERKCGTCHTNFAPNLHQKAWLMPVPPPVPYFRLEANNSCGTAE